MNNNNEISIRIRTVRENAGENLSEFSRNIGIPRSTLVGYENQSTIPANVLHAIATKYSISEEWLLSGVGDMKKADKLANHWESDSHQKADKLANRWEGVAHQQADLLAVEEVNNLTVCWENASHQKVKNLTNDWEAIPIGKQETLPIKDTISDSLESLALASTAPKFAELEEKMDGKFSAQEEKLNGLQKQLDDLKSAFSSGAKPKEAPLPRAEEVKEVAPPYGADCEADQEETVELPLAENLAAGMPREAFSTGETFSVPAKFLKKRKKYCVAKIKGTSMTEAGIADGAFVLLEVNETPVCGAIALVRYGNQTTLKRLHQKDDGTWELWYEDGSGAVIPLKDGEWEVIGWFVRVVGSVRG